MGWRSSDRRMERQVLLLPCIRKPDAQLKVVEPDTCLENTELAGFVPVERLIWVQYV